MVPQRDGQWEIDPGTLEPESIRVYIKLLNLHREGLQGEYGEIR